MFSILIRFMAEAATIGVLYKKAFLKNFAEFIGINLCQGLSLEASNLIKKETLAQIFSCEFYEIFKDTFFTELLRTSASVMALTLIHRHMVMCQG